MVVRNVKRLIFDIETAALPNVEELIPEPKIDARVKDPEKIAAQREEKIAEAIERAALDADLSSIRLISTLVYPGGTPEIFMVPAGKKVVGKAAITKMMAKATEIIGAKTLAAAMPNGFLVSIVDEATAISRFWGLLTLCGGLSVGYNSIAFDLPFIMRRSFDLGIQPTTMPSLAKYRDQPTTDLYGLLFNWSWSDTKKLKWLASRYGLAVLTPEVDGSQVAEMTDAELLAYGLSDLYVTEQLYKRMDGIYFGHDWRNIR